MQHKNHNGHCSLDLESGQDDKTFKPTLEFNRLNSSKIELSSEQTARAKRILEQNVLISPDDHSFAAPETLEGFLVVRVLKAGWWK